MQFSIIVPMFNAEKYIEECINSVVNQTFQEFEVIVINDGSQDSSLEIAKRYAHLDNRIKIINQNNKGLFYTRCVGIENAKGKYIIFIDADDKLRLNALETINKHINNGNYDMIIYSAEFLYNNGRTKPFPPLFDSNKVFQESDKTDLYLKILNGYSLNNMWIKAIRKNCFEIERYKTFPKITMGEDLLHTLYPLTNAKKIKYIDEVLYQYRIIDNSMTRTFHPNVYESTRVIHLEMKRVLERWEMNKEILNDLLIKHFLRRVGKIILYSPADISNSEEKYVRMLETINGDDLFINALRKKNKLELYTRISLRLLVKRKYYLLIFLKKIIVKIRKIMKR